MAPDIVILKPDIWRISISSLKRKPRRKNVRSERKGRRNGEKEGKERITFKSD